MLCPNPACAAMEPRPALMIADRQGIEIDYCPHCRGVWLDRGELDKLIERAVPAVAPAPVAAESRPWKEEHKPWKDDKHHGYGHHHYGKRKKSLLGEIFDF